MTKTPQEPDTPDESIEQDPGIPGPATKKGSRWPPDSGTASASNEEGFVGDPREGEDTSVSEAIDREPRHRADEDRSNAQ